MNTTKFPNRGKQPKIRNTHFSFFYINYYESKRALVDCYMVYAIYGVQKPYPSKKEKNSSSFVRQEKSGHEDQALPNVFFIIAYTV